MSPEEDRTRDTVDSEPMQYQLSYSGPCLCIRQERSIDPFLFFFLSFFFQFPFVTSIENRNFLKLLEISQGFFLVE